MTQCRCRKKSDGTHRVNFQIGCDANYYMENHHISKLDMHNSNNHEHRGNAATHFSDDEGATSEGEAGDAGENEEETNDDLVNDERRIPQSTESDL